MPLYRDAITGRMKHRATDDVDRTGATLGAPGPHTHVQADITDWPLTIANGGTGQATATAAFNALIAGILTTNGDLLTRAGGASARIGVGSNGDLLTVVAGAPAWAAAPSPTHALLSATHSDTVAATVVRGDLIVGNATPAWARFARGAANTVLNMNGAGTDPEWDTLVNANIAAGAAIDATKIADGTVTSAEFQFINTLTSNAQTQLDGKQPLDTDLTAIAALSGTGYLAHTGAGTWAERTFVAPAAGLTISNPAGIAGSSTFALANDLAALEGLAVNGIPERIGLDNWAMIAPVRGGVIVANATPLFAALSITGTANQVLHSDGTDATWAALANADLPSLTSAQWATHVSDETGTGLWVFNDTPTFATKIVTPRIDGGTAPGGNLTLNSTTDSTIAAILLHTTATKASDDISGDICTMLESRGALDFAGNDLLSAFFVGGDSSTSPFGRATWNITASQATLQGCNLFTFQPNITNSPSGTARSSGSWTALNNTPQFRNAGAVTHTIAEAKAINNAINLRRVTAATGNTTLTLAKGLNDAPTIGAGCTITTRYGVHFQNFTAGTGGAGVQTTVVGLQVEDQTVIDSDPGPVGSAIGFRSAMVAGVVTGTGVAPAKWHFLFTGTAPSASLGPIVVGAAAAPSHPNIALDVQSTTQVLRLTPMTTTQRDAMTTDAGSGFKHTVGMVIYNSTAATIQVCTANGAPGTWLGL